MGKLIATPRGVSFQIGATWTWEHFDRQGRLKGVQRNHNLVPLEGRNSLLDVYFHNATQIGTWYCIMFGSDYTPLDADTYAVPGFTEFTSYNEATRPEFIEGAASAGTLTNSSSRAIFTMTIESMIYGSGLVGGGAAASTKGDVAGGGTLFSAARMASPQLYSVGEIVRVTVNLMAVSG